MGWLDSLLAGVAGGSKGYLQGYQWLQEQEERKREEQRRLALDQERRAQQQLENEERQSQRDISNQVQARNLSLGMHEATNGTISEKDPMAPSWMQGGILPSENLSPYPAAQAPNRLAPTEVPGVEALNVPGAQLPRRFREDVESEKIRNMRAEAAARAEETRAAQDAAWPSKAREIEYGADARAAANARYRRPLKGEAAPGPKEPKQVPGSQQATAFRRMKTDLDKLEADSHTQGTHGNLTVPVEDLDQKKLDILNAYRLAMGQPMVESIEEAGWSPTGKPAPPIPVRGAQPAPTVTPAAIAPAAPVAPAAPTAPAAGSSHAVGEIKVFKNGRKGQWDGTGWVEIQ